LDNLQQPTTAVSALGTQTHKNVLNLHEDKSATENMKAINSLLIDFEKHKRPILNAIKTIEPDFGIENLEYFIQQVGDIEASIKNLRDTFNKTQQISIYDLHEAQSAIMAAESNLIILSGETNSIKISSLLLQIQDKVLKFMRTTYLDKIKAD
ncbi:hypothetical protein KKD70_00285, partial [Patescibacteria group bacterium]|nr:hypothetical protein [Patescibacteria group bacterium]